jgi:hypothetical protein
MSGKGLVRMRRISEKEEEAALFILYPMSVLRVLDVMSYGDLLEAGLDGQVYGEHLALL